MLQLSHSHQLTHFVIVDLELLRDIAFSKLRNTTYIFETAYVSKYVGQT